MGPKKVESSIDKKEEEKSNIELNTLIVSLCP